MHHRIPSEMVFMMIYMAENVEIVGDYIDILLYENRADSTYT